MKLFAPEYYKNFVCIADRCRHSCCIGWEIDVDGEAAEKYRSLCGSYAEKIRKSIEDNGEGAPHFKLEENERCPHLNAGGLCNIILEYGEGFLCDICREHPRFYNATARGMEVGLGMACEEACRIILGSGTYANIVEIGDGEDTEIDGSNLETLKKRDFIYSVLSDTSLSHEEKLRAVYDSFLLSPTLLTDGESRQLLESLEYLDGEHKELFSCYSSDISTPVGFEVLLERALAYFVYRHFSPSLDEPERRASLCLCLFCERLLASLIKKSALAPHDFEAVCELARIVSEEIEYSEENTDTIKFEFSLLL